MSTIGALVFGANLFCLILLWRRRTDDIRMRSAWVCSRNDVIGNIGVLIAAAAVALTGSAWPDIIIGRVRTVGRSGHPRGLAGGRSFKLRHRGRLAGGGVLRHVTRRLVSCANGDWLAPRGSEGASNAP
jgi:hypothetical protein